eukprot:RCo040066
MTLVRLPNDLLLFSFQFLRLRSQVELRQLCLRFRTLVDASLAPKWKVVLRLPQSLESPGKEGHGVLDKMKLCCSAAEIAIKGSNLVVFFTLLRNPSAPLLFLNLKSLDVGKNNFGASGMRALLASPFIPGLTFLDVSHNKIEN